MLRHICRFLFLVFLSLHLPLKAWSTSEQEEEHILVSMRMIGHELLLASGDSSSRVLPITKEDDRYKIRFASKFSFDPQLLTYVIDSILEENQIASSYSVEIKDCDSSLVVYSYEVDKENQVDLIPCMGRPQEIGCYIILLRILSPATPSNAQEEHTNIENGSLNSGKYLSASASQILFYVLIGFVLCLLILLRIRKRPIKNGSHLISIGSFLFDQKNMSLFKGNEKQDLTGKESDLLQLLHVHLNSTVDRDVILKEVWRDEGAYIGRTLDVYISKLRKKFESDPSISIINVRGVGYKMTLN